MITRSYLDCLTRKKQPSPKWITAVKVQLCSSSKDNRYRGLWVGYELEAMDEWLTKQPLSKG